MVALAGERGKRWVNQPVGGKRERDNKKEGGKEKEEEEGGG